MTMDFTPSPHAEAIRLFGIPRIRTVLQDQEMLGMPWPATPWQWQLLPEKYSRARNTGFTSYFTEIPCRRGHVSPRVTNTQQCTQCMLERSRNLNEAQKIKARVANREYRSRNIEEQKARERRWWHENKEKRLSYMKMKYRKDPKKVIAYVLARDRRVRDATPPWADMNEIRAFYRACPDGHHVDHVIPIKHALICGLHVIDNLQYLPAAENIRKRNFFDVEAYNDGLFTKSSSPNIREPDTDS